MVDWAGMTKLMSAAYYGHDDCVKTLLAVCDPKAKSEFGMTALILAAGRGRIDTLRLLLPLSDIHAKNFEDMTALDNAIWCENWECAEVIRTFAKAQREEAELESLITPTENKNKTEGRL